MDDVLSVYEPPLRARKTYFQVRQVLREFSEVPGVRTTHDLDTRAIAGWIKAHPGRSPMRTSSLLRTLSACVAYGRAEKLISKDPFAFRGVKDWVRQEVLSPDTPKAPAHRTAEEITALLRTVDAEAEGGEWSEGRLQALVYTYAFLGLRKGEALHLRRWDVDLKRRELTIQPTKSWQPKTRKSAAKLPMPGPLAEVMELWEPRTGCDWLFPGVRLKGPWNEGCPGTKPLDRVRQVGERAGIKGLTIASFRKTIGTYAKSWGLSSLELMKILRHTNIRTQQYYDEEDMDLFHTAVAKIDFGHRPLVRLHTA